MSLKDDIIKILEISVNAPSGDNSQPWHFVIDKNNKVDLFNYEGRDATIFNFKNRGDFLAHGALIENIEIAASNFGYYVEVFLFPSQNNLNHTATILFKEKSIKKDGLFEYIKERSTNRKKYQEYLLSQTDIEKIKNSNKKQNEVFVKIINSPEKIKELSKIASLNEKLFLENKFIHDFLFSIIRWTKKEEMEKPGMYIKTLELKPPQRIGFKLFKNWKIVERFNKFGLSDSIARENAKIYQSSSAIIAITIKNNLPESFVIAGRVFQRLWLENTRLGLSLQPLAAVPYLGQRIKEGNFDNLENYQIELVKNANKNIRDIFELENNDVVAMMFRIGKSSKPTAKSFKFKPNIKFIQ